MAEATDTPDTSQEQLQSPAQAALRLAMCESRVRYAPNTGELRLPYPGDETFIVDTRTDKVIGIEKNLDEPLPGYED